MHGYLTLLLPALLTSVLASCSIATAQYNREETRAAMQKIFAGLRDALPVAVGEKGFSDPAQRARVHAALAQLAGEAEILDNHAKGFDAGGRYLARSLTRDARMALERFEGAHYDAAEFSFLQTAESCVACHSRLASPGDSPLAADFFAGSELADLPLLARARLQIATRRFEDALKTLERAFASSELEPYTMLEPLTDYLVVSVRVLDDVARPIPVLRRFAQRDDLWAQLRRDVQAWAAALEEAAQGPPAPESLPAARALIEAGPRSALHLSDRRALVHHLLASRVLHRFVATHRDASPELAEAYYLLGLAESRIGRSFWVSQADFYLETAVRTAPGSPIGREAFAFLEEETLLGYTGSGGLHLPDEERKRLDELRALIAEPAAPRAP